MSRICATAILVALPLTAPANAKTPAKCKRLHGHATKVCLHKKAAAKPVPVTTTVLDGSTLTTSAGTFGITGTISATIPSKLQLNTPTIATFSRGTLTTAAGGPCGSVALPAANPYGPPPGLMVLNSDGTVLASLRLTLPDCGDATTLLLGGKASQPDGLNALVLDSIPGPVTAHLVVKVDLSGKV
jgi:hypothetical protein